MLFPHAHQSPDAIALDDQLRTRTWAELEERSLRIAHLLREELGLAPGEHAALLLANRVECIELCLGALLAGIWITPINSHLTAAEVRYVISDSGAKVLFCDVSHEAVARKCTEARLVQVGSELDEALGNAAATPLDLDGPAGSHMIYTSGTSGRPKGVKRSPPARLEEAFAFYREMGEGLGLDGSGPHLVTGPLYHAAPLAYALWDLLNGAPLVIMPRWDASETLSLKMIEWWGPVLTEYWGATEGGTYTLASSVEWLAHPGTVGRALPNFEISAFDENGRRLPAGEIGTLFCRHRQLAQVFAYHGDAEKTRQAHPEPHFFTAGDVGFVDEEGYVFLCDRKSNTIISGGVNIYPTEIEQVLIEHPAVADVGVFGVPDAEWGESVKAAIELTPGWQGSAELEAEILGFAEERLATFKLPRSIDFMAELPRHPTGKLLTRKLRDPYWREHDGQI
jgi:acyl-CoA synthetase (AMP-forming)/AMP-acid ligase II